MPNVAVAIQTIGSVGIVTVDDVWGKETTIHQVFLHALGTLVALIPPGIVSFFSLLVECLG